MSLRRYTEKRDFTKTPEPKGGAPGKLKSGLRRFVIQKHEASHLHYDFRLEIGGTLKSWAVPKGIPFAKGEKRLAMHVEDHPISYRDFEGVIPKGQYGGGTVMVWDYGTFQTQSPTPAKDLAGGKLHFILQGKKLSGEWYLVRLKNDDKQWLLIRGGDDMKPVSKKQDDTSALSGKTMAALSNSKNIWHSNRTASSSTASSRTAPVRTASAGALLPFFEPMMAKLVKRASAGDWQYEIKYDGFRALAFIQNKDNVRLISRNEKDLGNKFPEVLKSLRLLPTDNTILDGEIVALDSKGRSSFQLLQNRESGDQAPPLVYYIFDVPQQDGTDLRSVPLEERQARIKKLIRRPTGVLRVSEVLNGDGDALLEQARKLGLEGLIGKKAYSLYESGRRSGAWIKLKTHREQEFVIGGYSDPTGGRQHFGALLLGYYESRKLRFCGKVGTGFNDSTLGSLRTKFRELESAECPFANLPESRKGRFGIGMTRAEMRRCHWLKPELVCQVRFSEWTDDYMLRQPVYLGLREDKNASDVVREEAS
jgi:bifunctional non-homologous end joining protein LigD